MCVFEYVWIKDEALIKYEFGNMEVTPIEYMIFFYIKNGSFERNSLTKADEFVCLFFWDKMLLSLLL